MTGNRIHPDGRALTRAFDNAVGVFRALALASRAGQCFDGDGVVLIHTGSPLPDFNPAFVTRLPQDIPAMFRRIDSFYTRHGAPTVVYARSADAPSINDHAEQSGYRRSGAERGLVMSSRGISIPAPPDGLEIVVVRDAHALDAFQQTSARAFGAPRSWLGTLDIQRLLAVPSLTLYLGLVGKEPVSTAALFTSGDMAGVHIIGSTPEYRRRGIGQAMTWRVIRDGMNAGCTMCALTSSDLSHRMYERMGFEHVADYAVWEKA